MSAEKETSAAMLKSFTRPHSQNHPVWLKASLKNHWSKEIWPPSSPGCDPLDYFMWSEFEREVNKQPHNTLASLNSNPGGMGRK